MGQRVQLNPGQPFWMLVREDPRNPYVHLSYCNPGPVVLPDDLTEEEQQRVELALRLGILGSPDQPAAKVTSPFPDLGDPYRDPQEVAQELLSQKLKPLLAQVEELQQRGRRDILEHLYHLEKEGKGGEHPRKHLLLALEKALSQCPGPGAVEEEAETEVQICEP